MGRLVGKPGLSDTRLAGDGDDSAAPFARRFGGGRKHFELTRSFDEEPRQHARSLALRCLRKLSRARCSSQGPANGVYLERCGMNEDPAIEVGKSGRPDIHLAGGRRPFGELPNLGSRLPGNFSTSVEGAWSLKLPG